MLKHWTRSLLCVCACVCGHGHCSHSAAEIFMILRNSSALCARRDVSSTAEVGRFGEDKSLSRHTLSQARTVRLPFDQPQERAPHAGKEWQDLRRIWCCAHILCNGTPECNNNIDRLKFGVRTAPQLLSVTCYVLHHKQLEAQLVASAILLAFLILQSKFTRERCSQEAHQFAFPTYVLMISQYVRKPHGWILQSRKWVVASMIPAVCQEVLT